MINNAVNTKETSMSVNDIQGLFVHEVQDMYYAEQKLVEALGELARESTRQDLQQAFLSHRQETQGHVQRLEQVFQILGMPPKAETCQGIEGLIKEKKTFTSKESPTPDILDMYNIGAAQKTERYEMTAYENLIMMAQQLGLTQAVQLLQQNLQEEQAAFQKLQTLSRQGNPVQPGMAAQPTHQVVI
jgi:ferritin-like metal-binding protein YciE